MLVERQKLLLICCGSAERYTDRYPDLQCGPLEPEKKALLQKHIDAEVYPPVDAVYVGNCICCKETAVQIYPQQEAVMTDEIQPFDYGRFCGKSLNELARDSEFWAWMDSGAIACPGGGDPMQYRSRCQKAVADIAEEMYRQGKECAAIIAHPEFIRMALAKCGFARRMAWNGQIEKGDAFLVEYECCSQAMALLEEIKKPRPRNRPGKDL